MTVIKSGFSLLQRMIVAIGALAVARYALANETVEYVHIDALGSPVAITDASGGVIERTAYEPYGVVVNRPLTDGPGYAGHVADATTGLSYMQQRYYEPSLGAFVSVDPVVAVTGSAANFNRYRYANGNPYGYVDPDGRDAFYFNDANILVIPVYFTGASATKSNVEVIRSRVNSIGSEYRGMRVVLQVLSSPGGAGTNVMNLAPERDYRNYSVAGEGVNRLGGNRGHIDTTGVDWIGATTHDIMHFAGAEDGYVPSGNRGSRTSVPKDGYTNSHIMADRGGKSLRARDEDAILSNESTSKLNLRDFKGFHRIEGRLDAKRLDRQFSGKSK